MTIGASTGGFTDCLLQNGAEKVYSVDVGYGQLDWKLRSDDRVVNLERTNFRNLEPGTLNHSNFINSFLFPQMNAEKINENLCYQCSIHEYPKSDIAFHISHFTFHI